MSRIDKYDPIAGGFRANLAAAIVVGNAGVIQGVSINTSGKAVQGAATIATYRGLICPDRAFAANEPIDIMTDGEMVEVPTFTAGVPVYIDVATGLLTATAASNQYIGHMVELNRLVVRLGRSTP